MKDENDAFSIKKNENMGTSVLLSKQDTNDKDVLEKVSYRIEKTHRRMKAIYDLILYYVLFKVSWFIFVELLRVIIR